jgi:uncharacterized BrkB/YihY/UPF0761 family membrane protein
MGWCCCDFASLLFRKTGLGLYLGKDAVGSSYGAAGSILVLLLWVYYSGLIFYFGAEFTKIYTDRYGFTQNDTEPKITGKTSSPYQIGPR